MLLMVSAGAVAVVGLMIWLIRRHSSWIATKVALALCVLYVLLGLAVAIDETTSRDDRGISIESATTEVVWVGQLVLPPILAVGVVIDLGIIAVRRIRRSGEGPVEGP
jgi:hypothetical protein